MTNGDGLFVGDKVLAAGAASSKSPNSSSSGSFGDFCSIFVTFVTAEDDDGDTEELTSEDGLVTELLTGLVTVLESIALRYSEEKSKLKLGTMGKLENFIRVHYSKNIYSFSPCD